MHALIALWPVAYQTFIIYIFLIFSLRFFSQGRLGQLSVIDLVIILLLGTCVETSMVAFNNRLSGGLVSAATLLLANRLMVWILPHMGKLKKIVSCDPILLVSDGQFVREHLRRLGLTQADVLEALREHEHADISEIKYAVMEADGEINVVPKDTVVLRSQHKKHRHHPAADAS